MQRSDSDGVCDSVSPSHRDLRSSRITEPGDAIASADPSPAGSNAYRVARGHGDGDRGGLSSGADPIPASGNAHVHRDAHSAA